MRKEGGSMLFCTVAPAEAQRPRREQLYRKAIFCRSCLLPISVLLVVRATLIEPLVELSAICWPKDIWLCSLLWVLACSLIPIGGFALIGGSGEVTAARVFSWKGGMRPTPRFRMPHPLVSRG